MLTAEPGSGKTTLVPLLLLDEPWLAGRRILILEPRRPAARMAARRMAHLLNQRVGETVGYQVRFERRVSASTRIEVLTEGLLLRRLQADPELSDVGLVIFDEFHERHLQGDLSLAFCLDVAQGLRDDLRLLVMSASLDPAALCRLMPARAVRAVGRSFPVEIVHTSDDGDPRDPVPRCLRLLESACHDTGGDVLVFLPGRREIEVLLDAIAARWPGDALLPLPLYGDLGSEAQERVLQRPLGGPRRVIVATDIAETSLTIQGITAVVDSGLARRPVFDPKTGLTRLETQWINRASALQRAGRAGRLGPGCCYRAWSETRHARLADAAEPEIRLADLAGAVLQVAAWGTTIDGLSWLDPPPSAAWGNGVRLLEELGALQGRGGITPLGRRMSRFPTHPRLAHLLARAGTAQERQMAADVAAILSERDPLRGDGLPLAGVDITRRVDVLTQYRYHETLPDAVDRSALRQIEKASRQFLRLCEPGDTRSETGMTAGECLLFAYPDRVAAVTPGDGRRYRLRSGRAARLRPDDPLIGQPFLVIAALDAGKREGRIDLAAAIDRSLIESVCASQIDDRRELRWDDARSDVVARRVRRLDALVLREEAVPLRPSDPIVGLLTERVDRVGLENVVPLPRALMARVELMRGLEPEAGWPDFTAEGLTATLGDWLAPWLVPGEGLRQLKRLDVTHLLRVHLGHDLEHRLKRQLPERFKTPAGTEHPIQYAFDADPMLALPMQELFGEAVGPRLADGRIPVVLHLLSPARRPLQITRDLSAFWAGAYAEVKKEMRGRYPKHFWPDDPASTPATRSLKRRR